MTNKEFQVPTHSPPYTKTVSDKLPTHSCNGTTNQGLYEVEPRSGRDSPIQNMCIMQNGPLNKSSFLTLLDSGASDHCFVDRGLFVSYSPLDYPLTGLGAEKDSTFEILRKGKVKFSTNLDDKQQNISLDNVLYTSNLRSNLISISKLVSRGANVVFNDQTAEVMLRDGTRVMKAI